MSGYWQGGRRVSPDEIDLVEYDEWVLEQARRRVRGISRDLEARRCKTRAAVCAVKVRKDRCE